MASVFDGNFRYTEVASDIEMRVRHALAPIMGDLAGKCGHSPREISHLMMGVAFDLEMEAVLELGRRQKG